jgi:hypothetical protein
MTVSTVLVALDDTRTALVDHFDAMTDAQRGFQPEPGVWPPEAVAEHLLLVERGILAGIARSAGTDLGRSSPDAVEGLLAVMRSDRRAQTPPFLAPAGRGYAETRIGLLTLHPQWQQAVEAHDGTDRSVFVHPAGGPMSLLDTIRFVEAHAAHHQHQLARIALAPGYPV